MFMERNSDPHSDWIGITGELGIVGFFIAFVFLVRVAKEVVDLLISKKDLSNNFITLTIISLFIYVFSVGLTSSYIWRKIYWLVLAMTLSLPSLVNNNWNRFPIQKNKIN